VVGVQGSGFRFYGFGEFRGWGSVVRIEGIEFKV